MVLPVQMHMEEESRLRWTDGISILFENSEGSSVQGHSLRVKRAGADRFLFFISE